MTQSDTETIPAYNPNVDVADRHPGRRMTPGEGGLSAGWLPSPVGRTLGTREGG